MEKVQVYLIKPAKPNVVLPLIGYALLVTHVALALRMVVADRIVNGN
jgi:hypothetical protein